MSNQPAAVIIGATGLVGRGIVGALCGAGWRVIAAARDGAKLSALSAEFDQVATVVGSVADDRSAGHLAEEVRQLAGAPDAVIATVNLPIVEERLSDMPSERLVEVLGGNVVTHFCAAKAFLPILAPAGRYIGIGGGMADFMAPGMGSVSMSQAAQRNMFRFLADENPGRSIVELMLLSYIVDPADEATADPRHIRTDEVGAHVRAVLERPEEFAGPILALKSRGQVGQPERAK